MVLIVFMGCTTKLVKTCFDTTHKPSTLQPIFSNKILYYNFFLIIQQLFFFSLNRSPSPSFI